MERLLGKPCTIWLHTVKTVVNSNMGGGKLYLFGTEYGLVMGFYEVGNKP